VIQTDPFQTYYSTFPRHAYEADAILIGGYGFGDEHVNSVLANALLARKGDRPPVLVLDRDGKRKQKVDDVSPVERLLCRRCDDWRYHLEEALPVSDLYRYEATDRPTKPPSSPPMMPLKKEQFEVSSDAASPCPVAVWFGGFDAASIRLDQISEWLERAKNVVQPTG
jgi:hypothetical protein